MCVYSLPEEHFILDTIFVIFAVGDVFLGKLFRPEVKRTQIGNDAKDIGQEEVWFLCDFTMILCDTAAPIIVFSTLPKFIFTV